MSLAKLSSPGLKIILKTAFQIVSERYETLLVTFTGYLDDTRTEVNVPVIESYQLCHTHSGLIEGCYHGPVPDSYESLSQIYFCIIQEFVHIGLLDELGQRFLVLGSFYALNRGSVRDTLYAKESVKGTQGAQFAVYGGGFLTLVHHFHNPETHHIPVGSKQIQIGVSLLKEVLEKDKVPSVTGYGFRGVVPL